MGNIAAVLDRVRAHATRARKRSTTSSRSWLAAAVASGRGPAYGCTERSAEAAWGIYNDDQKSTYRCSTRTLHQQVYDEFLEKPNSHKAHELLHTHYEKKELY
jgi:hypothetical protein